MSSDAADAGAPPITAGEAAAFAAYAAVWDDNNGTGSGSGNGPKTHDMNMNMSMMMSMDDDACGGVAYDMNMNMKMSMDDDACPPMPPRQSENRPTNAPKGGRKEKLPEGAVATLKAWLLSPEHINHPYPTPQDKAMLMQKTGIDKMQLKNWFTNARRRIWRPLMNKQPEQGQQLPTMAGAAGGGVGSAAIPPGGGTGGNADAAAAIDVKLYRTLMRLSSCQAESHVSRKRLFDPFGVDANEYGALFGLHLFISASSACRMPAAPDGESTSRVEAVAGDGAGGPQLGVGARASADGPTPNDPSNGNGNANANADPAPTARTEQTADGHNHGTANPTNNPTAQPLYRPSDDDWLSPQLCLVRKQMECFAADQRDFDERSQNGRAPPAMGQVGLRCVHCTQIPLNTRAKVSVLYPKSVKAIQMAMHNFQRSHLLSCPAMPPNVKQRYAAIRNKTIKAVRSKKALIYLAQSCKDMGVVEKGGYLQMGMQEDLSAFGPSAAIHASPSSTGLPPIIEFQPALSTMGPNAYFAAAADWLRIHGVSDSDDEQDWPDVMYGWCGTELSLEPAASVVADYTVGEKNSTSRGAKSGGANHTPLTVRDTPGKALDALDLLKPRAVARTDGEGPAKPKIPTLGYDAEGNASKWCASTDGTDVGAGAGTAGTGTGAQKKDPWDSSLFDKKPIRPWTNFKDGPEPTVHPETGLPFIGLSSPVPEMYVEESHDIGGSSSPSIAISAVNIDGAQDELEKSYCESNDGSSFANDDGDFHFCDDEGFEDDAETEAEGHGDNSWRVHTGHNRPLCGLQQLDTHTTGSTGPNRPLCGLQQLDS